MLQKGSMTSSREIFATAPRWLKYFDAHNLLIKFIAEDKLYLWRAKY